MSQRNRFADAALGLVIGLGIALLILVWAIPGFRDPAYQQITGETARQNDSRENPESHGNKPEWRQWAGRLFSTKDTIAQWIAAFAAIGSVGVSIWAVKLVRNTLVVNQRATQAAEDAVGVTREIGQAQIRAYLVGLGGEYSVSNNLLRYRISIKNIGQSPAVNCVMACRFEAPYRRGPSSAAANAEFGPARARVPAIMSGEVADPHFYFRTEQNASSANFGFMIPQVVMDDIKEGGRLLYHEVRCTVGWTDAFNKRQNQTFSLWEEDSQTSGVGDHARRSGKLRVQGVQHYTPDTEGKVSG